MRRDSGWGNACLVSRGPRLSPLHWRERVVRINRRKAAGGEGIGDEGEQRWNLMGLTADLLLSVCIREGCYMLALHLQISCTHNYESIKNPAIRDLGGGWAGKALAAQT